MGVRSSPAAGHDGGAVHTAARPDGLPLSDLETSKSPRRAKLSVGEHR